MMEIDLVDDQQPPGLMSRLSLAFWLQYNVILLFGCICFALALASSLPAVVGAAVEFLWLLVATAFPDISRWIDRHNRMADAAAADPSGSHRDLDPSHHHRASMLKQSGDRIGEACRHNGGVSRGETRSISKRLEAIRETFLRFADIHQRLSRFLSDVQTANIDAEVARLTDEVSAEKDLRVKISLRQALTLSRRRLLQREQVANTLRAIEVQMGTVETAFAYLDSVAGHASSGRDIESEIDAWVGRISPPDVLEAEVGSVLASALAPASMRPLAG
jgi:hypothetical protein